jgi:hypothetical protein
MFRETDIVRDTNKYTPRMQCRNELDKEEETIFKIAPCYQHKNWRELEDQNKKPCEEIWVLEQTLELFLRQMAGRLAATTWAEESWNGNNAYTQTFEYKQELG